MKRLFFGLALLLGTSMLSSAAETRFASGPQQTALVELYTSEGCSSCPSAEAWLSRQKDDPGLWKQFVPIAFHVDYWDRLGWRDRFSSKQWTERQSRYAALWQSESVYTPAVVVNGREQRSWSGTSLSQPNEKQAGTLAVTTSDGKTFAIEFHPARERRDRLGSSPRVTRLRDFHQCSGGRKQRAESEARFRRSRSRAGGNEIRCRKSARQPNDQSSRGNWSRKAVAIWVTPRGQLAPVQATGGWLP